MKAGLAQDPPGPPGAAGGTLHHRAAAGEVTGDRPETGPLPDQAQVLVQGIADLVLVFDDHAEILDYKTDRSRDPDFYRREYAGQLRLYRRAFALRLPVRSPG